MREENTCSVLIVDDHPVVRKGLKELIDAAPDLHACGCAASSSEALAAVKREHPDVVLMDLSLEGVADGLEVVRTVQHRWPHVPVLVLSMHEEHLYAPRALAAGARGYLQKRAPTEDILQGLRRVLSGRLHVSEGAASAPSAEGFDWASGAPVDDLSDRELEVFLLIGKGFEPRHIAERLGLSVKTVETYHRRLKQKLCLESASDLRRRAIAWQQAHSKI